MLRSYIRHAKDEGDEWRTYLDDLREQIMIIGKNMDAGTAGIRTGTAYHMMRKCPRLLICSYRVYHVFRQFIKNITGK